MRRHDGRKPKHCLSATASSRVRWGAAPLSPRNAVPACTDRDRYSTRPVSADMTSSTNTHAGRDAHASRSPFDIDLRVRPFLPSRFAALAELAALEAAEHAGGDAVAASPNVAAEATEARACTQRCNNVQCAWRTVRQRAKLAETLPAAADEVASVCDA